MYLNKTTEETLKLLETGKVGLTSAEAAARLEKEGRNQLTQSDRKNVFQVFFAQFKDLLVLILIGAALISYFTGNRESSLVIAAVIILNAILGTVQHIKAEKSLDALKGLATPSSKLLRDGQLREIDSRDIVPGDIMFLEAGDKVPADGRIIDNFSMQTNESALTGESGGIVRPRKH